MPLLGSKLEGGIIIDEDICSFALDLPFGFELIMLVDIGSFGFNREPDGCSTNFAVETFGDVVVVCCVCLLVNSDTTIFE